MTKARTEIQQAAGKLTFAIQKEWGKETGEPAAESSEIVMNLSHDFLRVAMQEDLQRILGGKSVAEYLGQEWLASHPSVTPYVEALESWL